MGTATVSHTVVTYTALLSYYNGYFNSACLVVASLSQNVQTTPVIVFCRFIDFICYSKRSETSRAKTFMLH